MNGPKHGDMNSPGTGAAVLSAGLLLAVLAWSVPVPGMTPEKAWYPVQVDVWDPPYNTGHKRVLKSYVPLERAARRWNLCVAIPHLKDTYWQAVNFGLVDEAKRLGVDMSIFEAGGYEHLDVQREQIRACLESGAADKPVDGIIISAVSAQDLNDLVSESRERGIPVVDLINGIDSKEISARVAVDFYDMGFLIGDYLRNLDGADKEEIEVAWFPGPEGAGWVAAGDAGFRAALAGSKVQIVATRKGDTGRAAQAALVESALDEMGTAAKGLDYIVGTAVTAEAAVGILRQHGLQDSTGVLAYYYGPGVNRGIRRGTVIAAPTDSPVTQARIAVDTMVRILEDRTWFAHVAPQIEVIDQARLQQWDPSTTLAPRGFRAIFSVHD